MRRSSQTSLHVSYRGISFSYRSAQDSTDGGASDVEAAGDLRLTDAGAMKLFDLASLFGHCYWSPERFAFQSRLSDAGANAFTQYLVFELREH